MHSFIKANKHTFIDNGVKTELSKTPIDQGEINRKVKRSPKSDSLTLDVTQNVKFIDDGATYLNDQLYTNGVGKTFEYLVERKQNETYKEVYRGFVDLESLKKTKNFTEVSFRDNGFDKRLRSNINTSFELDRTIDINNNPLPELDKKTMFFKKRQIFLRSKLETREAILYDEEGTYRYLAPPLKIKYESDVNINGTFRNILSNEIGIYPETQGDTTSNPAPEEQQFFYFNSDRQKTVKMSFDLDFDWKFPTSVLHSPGDPQAVNLRVIRSNYDDIDQTFTYIEETQIQVFNGVTDNNNFANFTYTSPSEAFFNLEEGDCLAVALAWDTGLAGYEFLPNKFDVFVSQDSYYEPDSPEENYVDVVSLYDAMERITSIMGVEIGFSSEHLINNWKTVMLTSGETMRHVLRDDTPPPLLTTSFEKLYKFAFTLSPVGYAINKIGKKLFIEFEDIGYFYDDSESIDIGEVFDVETTVFSEKIYKSVRVGYTKSGENEEVYGLFATHTVNEYGTPIDNTGKVYDATCDFRTDPNEAELCFRRQFSRYPDEDTKYDKDVFAFHCKEVVTNNDVTYHVREWQDDFVSVSGIYSPDTAYNYTLTPMNCFLRHGKNFKQELTRLAYNGLKTDFYSTKGDVSLSTETGAGTFKEDDRVLLTAFDDAMYTSELVSFKLNATDEVIDRLFGGYPKKNYYKKINFSIDGQKASGYINEMTIDDTIKIKAVITNG